MLLSASYLEPWAASASEGGWVSMTMDVISSRALSVCSPEVADVLLTDRVIYQVLVTSY